MVVEYRLTRVVQRLALGVAALVTCAVIATYSVSNFATDTLADQKFEISPGALESAASYFPLSPRLCARVAELELVNPERDLSLAEREALLSVQLSPDDYRNRLVLASVKEAQGDLGSAEKSLRDAMVLAPSNADVQWRFANLLLREHKMDEAIKSLRLATSSKPTLLPSALDLVWRMTGGNLDAVETLAPEQSPDARLELARFLETNSNPDEAIAVFNAVDMKSRLASNVTPDFIGRLLSIGRTASARKLWLALVSPSDPGRYEEHPVWDGSFETTPAKISAPFDWSIAPSRVAQIAIDPETGHTGGRSLRIDFIGSRDMRLGGEVKQTISLRPETRYRLECYVKTDRLSANEGPRVALNSSLAPSWAAVSAPVAAGTAGWNLLKFDFVTPGLDQESEAAKPAADSIPVVITIIHAPKNSYDSPMKGSVWFDDFEITDEAPGGAGSGREEKEGAR